MLQIVAGPPGSGKSYMAMNYLVGFTEFDELYKEYILREDVLIIANIEGLKIKHWDLDYCLKDKTVEEFFSIANFEAIQAKTKKTHIILVIDECHELFPPSFKNEEVYKFFAFHRHIGLDCILLTQGLDAMTRMLNPLFEYVVQATPRSKKLTKRFGYRYYDLRGRFLFPKTITSKQHVFNAYKSFRMDEKNKPRSAVMFWLVASCSLFVIGGGMFVYFISNLGGSRVQAAQIQEEAKPIQSVSLVANPKLQHLEKGISEKPDDTAWDLYHLDGYLEKEGKYYYLIGGKAFPDSAKFRNLDIHNLTVEYFGLPITRAGRSDSPLLREGAKASPRPAAVSPPSVGPLARSGPASGNPDHIAMPPNRQTAGKVVKPRVIREYLPDPGETP